MVSAPNILVTRSIVSVPVTDGPPKVPAAAIAKLKQLVVNHAAVVSSAKTQLALAQAALARLPAADVEAVVIPGYPPSL